MAAPEITPSQLDERRQHVEEVLARSPHMTLHAFAKNYSYQRTWLKQLEADGIVVFGKPVKQGIRLTKTRR